MDLTTGKVISEKDLENSLKKAKSLQEKQVILDNHIELTDEEAKMVAGMTMKEKKKFLSLKRTEKARSKKLNKELSDRTRRKLQMEKQGKSPLKTVKCGIWLKKEERFISIQEFKKLKAINQVSIRRIKYELRPLRETEIF